MNLADREYGLGSFNAKRNEPIHGDRHSAMELYAKECSWLMTEFTKKCPVPKTESNEFCGTSFDISKKEEISGEKLWNLRYTSFDHEAAAAAAAVIVAQLIMPSLKDQSREVVTIISLAAEGNTSRYLYLSNNASRELNLEEECFLKPEQVCPQLLNLLKKPGTGCRHTKLCIRHTGCSFSREAAALVVGLMLSSIKHELAEVELSDLVVSGRNGDEALEVVRILSSALEGCGLRYLNLSDNALSNEKGIRAFGALLKSQNNLEELYLLNVGISEEAAKALRDLIPSTGKLRVLHFHENHLYITGAVYISEIVRRCPMLQDFRCTNSRVHTEGGIFIARALTKCHHIKKLDLRHNLFMGNGGLALCKTLPEFSDLSEIYLSHLELNDKATGFLAYYLKVSAPSLQVLDMAGNSIGDASARDLASCIASKRSLVKLNLAANFLGDEGAILIAKALDEGIHDQLCEVDLSRNFIGLDGGVALVRAALRKPQLKVLNITRNKIYPKDWKSKEVLL